jgi:hypothetical protein
MEIARSRDNGSLSNVSEVFNSWCCLERQRLLEQEHELFSDIERLRASAAVDKDNPANYTYQKSMGHLGRIGVRLQQLEISSYNPDVAGFALFSCLKLAVGQQVRFAYTSSETQSEFNYVMSNYELVDPIASSITDTTDQYQTMKPEYIEALDVTTELAALGTDWSLKQSKSLDAIVYGEQLSISMAYSIFDAIAMNVPVVSIALRPPSSDADEVPLSYPFA